VYISILSFIFLVGVVFPSFCLHCVLLSMFTSCIGCLVLWPQDWVNTSTIIGDWRCLMLCNDSKVRQQLMSHDVNNMLRYFTCSCRQGTLSVFPSVCVFICLSVCLSILSDTYWCLQCTLWVSIYLCLSVSVSLSVSVYVVRYLLMSSAHLLYHCLKYAIAIGPTRVTWRE